MPIGRRIIIQNILRPSFFGVRIIIVQQFPILPIGFFHCVNMRKYHSQFIRTYPWRIENINTFFFRKVSRAKFHSSSRFRSRTIKSVLIGIHLHQHFFTSYIRIFHFSIYQIFRSNIPLNNPSIITCCHPTNTPLRQASLICFSIRRAYSCGL